MKILQALIILCLLLPTSIHAEMELTELQAAFVRDGYLWTNINQKEEKITTERAHYTSSLAWSFDGSRLLYQKQGKDASQNEIWVYDTNTKQHTKIFYDGSDAKWSPDENIIAFKSQNVLNISDLKTFYNIALGVCDYEWQPDGKGFIVSSRAVLQPTGWTNSTLYNIPMKEGYQNISNLTANVKELFVIPTQVKKGDITLMAIQATDFSYSPDARWISFIVSPTASMSMDINMLCFISNEGKSFEAIDEVILHLDNPKWALTKNRLGYIAGGGRIVFGFKDKDLKVTELPSSTSTRLTPPNYAELGFTWVNDHSLIVSRVKESKWSNEPEKRPKPALYNLDISGYGQKKLTAPPEGYGDYDPKFLPSIEIMTWIRKADLTDHSGDLWIADRYGENAQLWIENVENYSLFSSDR
ncbi:TolB family protein [Alkalihalobacterium chitinilyticum]|uniref:TolB domain-containing protein n=1 Tax=Alkalihalobacterium chitinilyticum TaxID=2980103 RepID=A0ABT5VDR0_9BACI|nr:TolB domain-containing protein [Alkalihalobacterium chitinilyticum]MDE5413600.1 TolB domain-containing protein [Alkalihalobacterium chitinilyticum]